MTTNRKPLPRFARWALAFCVLMLAVIVGVVVLVSTSAPDYEVEQGYVAGVLHVTVPELTEADADSIMKHLAGGAREDGGYYVTFTCPGANEGRTQEDIHQNGYDAVLARGRFADGNLGAAQTGLDDGDFEVELEPGVTCSG